MKKLLIRLLINAIAIYIAISFMSTRGITTQSDSWLSIVFLAIIFGLVNATLRPILTTLGCSIIILTLGLATLLINTLLFYLTGVIGSSFGVGFTVDGFWPAFWGALIVSVVSFILSIFIKDEDKKK
ncbi:MAG: phage holin family protein [Anaerolineae bacterium]|nr:phage holin family protein [Anaerolineae bacterium]